MNRSEPPVAGVFDIEERAEMQQAIDAVCDELGISPNERARRMVIARRVVEAYRHGHRLPLNLVDAGLREVGV
jgi:hypothetical protein